MSWHVPQKRADREQGDELRRTQASRIVGEMWPWRVAMAAGHDLAFTRCPQVFA